MPSITGGVVIIASRPLRFLCGKIVYVSTEPIRVSSIVGENVRSILIKADSSNAAEVLIDNHNIAEDVSFRLEKGEAVSFDISNPGDVYLRAKSGVQKVHLIALGE